MTKITSFLMLAEPQRLQYPYAESIASLASFSDCVIVNFAASRNPRYRQFEKESYDKLLMLREKFSLTCEIKILMNETCSYQHEQTYNEIRCNIQNVLDEINDGWFLKCDSDNVFQDAKGVRNLLENLKDEYHLVSFPRIDVINKSKFILNNASRDIYAFNTSLLRNNKKDYSVSKDPRNWCRAEISGNYCHYIVADMQYMPINYDATFFNRHRIIEFWRKTADAYEHTTGLDNTISRMTDDQVIDDYVRYRKKKAASNSASNIKHPIFILDKIEKLTPDFWGYDNFGHKL